MGNVILWFRRDLRVADNPMLQHAIEQGGHVLPLYILDPRTTLGAASRWWLHHSLSHLQHRLRKLGLELFIQRGDPAEILTRLGARHAIDEVLWNRLYEPDTVQRDTDIKGALIDAGIAARSYNGSLLMEPWQMLKADGGPYRVFTPFWKVLNKRLLEAIPSAPPRQLPGLTIDTGEGLQLDALELLPDKPWDEGLYQHWHPGETGAHRRLQDALAGPLLHYPIARDHPDRDGTSRLSPHLHFGELSPRQIWYAVRSWSTGNSGPGYVEAGESYLRQIAWREFAHHLLYHFPHTAKTALDSRFEHYPWATGYTADLRAWQQGRTGIPIVDAGMRELWRTGWMHNRVRMLVASLLTKNLRIPWQEGAAWFWDTLVDADLANNSMGWQWVAGCGADAAPYFRIFNPVVQGERFDPDGSYVRRWVPELQALPNKWIHQPSSAPAELLAECGIELGRDYPRPIVELDESRKQALSAWEQIKGLPRG